MERVFHKLLWLGMTLVTLGIVIGAAGQMGTVMARARSGFLDIWLAAGAMALLVGRMMLTIAALYWVPRIVRQLVPDVLAR